MRSPPAATASASSPAGARRMSRSGSRAGRMNPTGLRVTSSARLQQRLIGTRSSNWIRPLVRRSWVGPVSGPTAYRISAWATRPAAVQEMVAQIEEALTPFEARPHWGKVFHADAAAIAPLYKRHSDFVRLVEQLDPRGAFRNSWLKARVLGDK